MTVTIAPDCFDPDAPVDPDWEDLDDDVDPTDVMTGHLEGGWEAEPRFRVPTDDPRRTADVLLVVAERFMRVGQSGTEHAAAAPYDDPGPSIATVAVDAEAAYVAADTSEWLSHEMVATMKRILVEELTAAGVSTEITADYDPVRGLDAEPWPSRA